MRIIPNGINDILLQHFAISEESAAGFLRYKIPSFPEKLSSFLHSRTDLGRLLAAEMVVGPILELNDLEEMSGIRSIVARQEMKHRIRYIKQQDHTAHTLYVYLLGLWLFDNVPQAKRSVIKKISKGWQAEDYLKTFLLQWAFASLLHDVGYVFYTLDETTREDRELIDDVFSWDWIQMQKGSTLAYDNPLKGLKEIHQKWEKEYLPKLGSGTAAAQSGDCVKILERLSAVPWIEVMFPEWRGKNVFEIFDGGNSGETPLRKYAHKVAEKGYDGKKESRCVDHAVASGLLLFQYSSYWYFLMNQLELAGAEGADEHTKMTTSKDKMRHFDYKPKNLRLDILPACRSAAYHNIRPEVDGATSVIRSITLERDPITFLSVLCDEIQKWDRFSAQEGDWDDLLKYAAAALEAGDIEIKVIEDDKFNRFARVHIHNKSYSSSGLRADLDKRLPGWRDVLSISSDRDGDDEVDKCLAEEN